MCDQLAAYLPRLEPLLAEPDHAVGYGDRMTGRISAAPLPGNPAALLAVTGIHGLARWWEAVLLYHHGANDMWGRRGGSDGNTLQALQSIVRLAAGADRETVGLLLADLGRAEADAGSIAAIDETQQWRHLRGRKCPYCHRLATLKVLLDARRRPLNRVECHGGARATGERCLDSNGMRPAATVAYQELRWADGLVEIAPDLDAG